MLSEFVVKFHALAALAGPPIGAVNTAILAGALVRSGLSALQDDRRPGDFYATAITKYDAFNFGHCRLLFNSNPFKTGIAAGYFTINTEQLA
jgi:hypothetical protein